MKPICKLSNDAWNRICIIHQVSETLKLVQPDTSKEFVERVASSESFGDVLAVAQQYVVIA